MGSTLWGETVSCDALKAPSYYDNIALKTKEEYLLYMVLLSICRLSAAISPLSLPQLLQHWTLAEGQSYTTVRNAYNARPHMFD